MSGGHQAAAGTNTGMQYGGATLPGFAPAANSVSPASASASISLNSSGAYTAAVSPAGTGGASGTWRDFGASADYECRLTGTGDSPGTLNTWQSLSSTRTWALNTVGAGLLSFSGTMEIRRAVGGNVVASCAVALSAFQL